MYVTKTVNYFTIIIKPYPFLIPAYFAPIAILGTVLAPIAISSPRFAPLQWKRPYFQWEIWLSKDIYSMSAYLILSMGYHEAKERMRKKNGRKNSHLDRIKTWN